VKISKEFKVGVLALVSFAILYFGFNFLKGINFFSPTYKYIIIYDKIDGLTESNPVQINGLNVGRVGAIRIVPELNFKLAVTIEVNKDIVLTDKTVALLSSTGVLGPRDIVLKINKGTRKLKMGDTLIAGELDDMMSMFAKKAQPLADSIEQTVTYLNTMLREYGQLSGQVRKVLENTEQMTASFSGMAADNRQSIRIAMDNAVKISGSFVETQKKFDPLMAKFGTFADSLNALRLATTVNKANSLIADLNKTMTAINQQKGSLGKMIYNDSLYTNLNGSLASLDSLLIDFRKRPKRYVHFSLFGRKDK
jgi:phospholipid/cholesterol/gamma-HCH transport system substrate-binding protein